MRTCRYCHSPAIHAILKNWQSQCHYYLDNPCDTKRLKLIYDQTTKEGLALSVDDSELCAQWQLPKRRMTCRDIWSQLIERVSSDLDNDNQRVLEYILSQGNLSERLLRACGNDQSKATITRVYRA